MNQFSYPSQVNVVSRYKYWRELLEHWVFLVERGFRVTDGQHAVYAYKERTNVGLLSASAVANGWVALEECRSKKFASEDGDDVYQGRSDLRIWRDKRHHELEAKFLRVPLISESTTRLDRVDEKAIADAARSVATGARFDRKIAVTFVVPMLTVSQLEKTSHEIIRSNLERLLKYIQSTIDSAR
ncbi:hypothetical protein [Sulfuritalea sp.]|uniref:hypothetical protein n=1 Tax=Sulfuritalea sp. TaxID=2480090 RepID=UPI001AD4714E|nr:hypothetical protein [Sulfuritalea sp.]MBN8477244.1 hypothetical protein [Sulfuritalea sp.]